VLLDAKVASLKRQFNTTHAEFLEKRVSAIGEINAKRKRCIEVRGRPTPWPFVSFCFFVSLFLFVWFLAGVSLRDACALSQGEAVT
jgi:hypothetical protein